MSDTEVSVEINTSSFMHSINIEDKSFHLCEVVSEATLGRVHIALQKLSKIEDDKPIRMYLSTTGGDVEAGLGIFDVLTALPSLEIVVVGYAYSMGILLLQAASERMMTPNSSLMAHWGHQAVDDDNKENYRRKLAFQSVLDEKCDNILLKRMKEKKKSMTLKKIQVLTEHDWYMGPKEAIKMGLADSILY